MFHPLSDLLRSGGYRVDLTWVFLPCGPRVAGSEVQVVPEPRC